MAFDPVEYDEDLEPEPMTKAELQQEKEDWEYHKWKERLDRGDLRILAI